MASVMDAVNQRTQLAGHNRLELLTFRLLGRQRFGINVFKIQEIVKCPRLNQIPRSHSVVRGVATMRGSTIPVIDLNMAIGRAAMTDTEGCYMIVTEYNRSVQGFLVGGVERIVNLTWSDITPPPKGSGKNCYLTAVTQIDNELVEIIDVERVLAEVSCLPLDVSSGITDSVEDLVQHQHILVVDDSGVARNQIRRTLEQLGIESTLANNGREALNLLKTWSKTDSHKLKNLAMVISDVEMPDMDGYTLTTEIRRDPLLQGIFILLHTSLSGTFNNAMIERVGADRFVPKFKPDDLAVVVLEQVRAFAHEKCNK